MHFGLYDRNSILSHQKKILHLRSTDFRLICSGSDLPDTVLAICKPNREASLTNDPLIARGINGNVLDEISSFDDPLHVFFY